MAWEDACEACRELLEAVEIGDRIVFRRRWVAAVTLLRLIGHVLKEADRELHPNLRNLIDAKWQEPLPAIFNGFIKEARDLTIKEYRSNLFGQWNCDSPMSLEPLGKDDVSSRELVFMGDTFKGEHLQNLLIEALDWWDQYLAEIEQATP